MDVKLNYDTFLQKKKEKKDINKYMETGTTGN